MFKSASKNSTAEMEARGRILSKVLRFGVEFVDDATLGIMPDDLVLLGAPSGAGKTQLCCNIALANMNDGHRVHYIALEASEFEIERRLKFPMVMKEFFDDPYRPNIQKIRYPHWMMGKYLLELSKYEAEAAKKFEEKYRDLFLYYKQDRFGVVELIRAVTAISQDTDLIIIDHLHYFDLDDDNENRAVKEIAKTVRTLCLEENKPIVLVAHLRKRDRHNEDLVAGLEEFHGSSDIFKIATKVITFSPGNKNLDGTYDTFFRVPKNRLDSDPIRYSGREFFDPKTGGYKPNSYEVGQAIQSKKRGFETIADNMYPEWARDRESSSGNTRAPSYGGLPYKD